MDVSVIIGVTPGLVGETNDTTNTVAYWAVDKVNVKCPPLPSPKFE